MADKEKNVVLNFKMDGQVKYAETLREINSVMNTAAKEYKNHVAAMGKDASATDKLVAEKKKLEIQMEAAQKRTKMLSAQYEAMSKDTKTTTGQLTQMYGKLLDAEKAETSLQKSMDRVNDGLSDQAQEARNAQDNLDKLKDESKLLESEQKSLTSSFKLQNAELDENASEAEKVELAQKQLQSQMKLTDRTVENLERQLEQTKKVYGENSVEVNQLETKINNARTTLAKFEKSLNGVEQEAEQTGDELKKLGSKMDLNNLLEATELLEGISDQLLNVGSLAFDAAMELGGSQEILMANLGLTADAAEELNDIVDEVYRNGVVDSIDEATQAVVIAKQTFEDLNDTELEDVVNKVIAIGKRTQTDVNENVRAASQLMGAFGISSTEAFDLIAAGFQNGLNRSEDFLDTLNEYAPHFENAGYTAEEMLQIINNGMENGAMNTDKAADAVKEFQIRLGDGSIEKEIETFSTGTQDLFKEWQDGKATVSDVAKSISKDLKKMSPTEQQQALSVLASQFEDLGIDGAQALFNIGKGFDDATGKANDFATKTPFEKWQSSLRDLQTAVAPIGEQIVQTLDPIVDVLTDMTEEFENLPEPIQTFVVAFAGLTGVAAIATPVIIGLAIAIGSLEVALWPIILVVAAVAAAIAGIIMVIKHWGAITDWLADKWNQTVAMFKVVFGSIYATFHKALDYIDLLTDGKFKSITDTMRNYLDMGWNNIKQILQFIENSFKNALDFISALVDGDFEGMAKAIFNQMRNIEDTVDNIWGNVEDFFGSINLWEMGKDIIAGFIDGFTSIDIPTPHFDISMGWKDIPGPAPSIPYPTVDVDWRAKGGIFTQPTIFGASGGRLQGAGEAGPEAVLPLNQKTLGDIGKGIAESMGASGDIAVHVYMDTDEITTKMAPGMSKQLNSNNKMKARQVGVIVT